MSSDIDRWLSQIDADALEDEIAELEREQSRLAAEIAKRQQVLELRKQWLRPAQGGGDQPAAEPEPERTPGRTTGAEPTLGEEPQPRQISDMGDKEQLLLGYLRDAGQPLHLREIRQRIAADGLAFEGTPERGVLWRMEQQGKVAKVRQGVYALPSESRADARLGGEGL